MMNHSTKELWVTLKMSKNQWTIKINFIPFESEEKRERSYSDWVQSFNHIKRSQTKKIKKHSKSKGGFKDIMKKTISMHG